ncbi:MAG TPA: pitrilysin family protein, partial [Longimicrobiales bacterium]|nr:pitrilysin family protein [Longimicrobiales bacterium]
RAAGDNTRVRELAARIETLEDTARAYVEPNELDRILTEAGARGLNATTRSEATTYFVELPANRAELWFLLESDRMRDPVFREFYAERRVVTEERRMRIETSPAGMLYEAHLAAAFTLHPYGVPVVGYMSDLEVLSRADVASYYRRFYGPNNAVVAIVGDVDPDQIETWARTYFGPLPRGEEPPPVLAREPPQLGERRLTIEWDAEPRLRIGWHVPSSLHADAPAIAIFASILTGGRTSRLHRRLVMDDRLATGVFASTGPGNRFPQLFQVDAVPRSPHGTEEIEAAIYEEIQRLAATGPSAAELERVRNQIAAGSVRRISTNLGLAFQLADSETLEGDWRATFRAAEDLQAVRAEDVRRVAAEYFTESNRTVAVLERAEAR